MLIQLRCKNYGENRNALCVLMDRRVQHAQTKTLYFTYWMTLKESRFFPPKRNTLQLQQVDEPVVCHFVTQSQSMLK